MLKAEKKQKKIVYQNKYNHVYCQEVDFGSFTKEYFVTDCGQKSGVVIIRKDNAVLLVRQYRPLIDELSWEIPGGKIEEKETPQEAIIRECLEETGVLCRNLKPLLNYHQTLETINALIYLFYTKDFEQEHDFTADLKEVESIQWVPLEESFGMIQEEKIKDSFTILALLAYRTFVEKEFQIHNIGPRP